MYNLLFYKEFISPISPIFIDVDDGRGFLFLVTKSPKSLIYGEVSD